MRTMKMKWHGKSSYPAGNVCACCCRPVDINTMHYVHVINGGSDVLHPDDEHLYNYAENEASDLGYNEIGSGCAKKFKGFTVKYDRVTQKYVKA